MKIKRIFYCIFVLSFSLFGIVAGDESNEIEWQIYTTRLENDRVEYVFPVELQSVNPLKVEATDGDGMYFSIEKLKVSKRLEYFYSLVYQLCQLPEILFISIVSFEVESYQPRIAWIEEDTLKMWVFIEGVDAFYIIESIISDPRYRNIDPDSLEIREEEFREVAFINSLKQAIFINSIQIQFEE